MCKIINNAKPDKYDSDEYVKCYAISKSLARNAVFSLNDFEFTGKTNEDVERIKAYISQSTQLSNADQVKRKFNTAEEKFKTIRENIYEYEFSDSDYQKIQEHINELRNLIRESDVLSESHQIRLLKQLEQFQSELHKRVANLDRALGF